MQKKRKEGKDRKKGRKKFHIHAKDTSQRLHIYIDNVNRITQTLQNFPFWQALLVAKYFSFAIYAYPAHLSKSLQKERLNS